MRLALRRILALLASLPTISIYLTGTSIGSLVQFLAQPLNLAYFLTGLLLSIIPIVLEVKYKVRFSISLVILLSISSILSYIKFFTPIYSSYIFLLPIVWICTSVTYSRRNGLVVLNPVFPYVLALTIWCSLHITSFQYLGVVLFEVLKVQVRSFVLPVKPLLTIYEPPPPSLYLYPIAVVASIVYLVEDSIYGWEGTIEYYYRLLQASRELVVSAIMSIPLLLILSFLIPSRLNYVFSFMLLATLYTYLGKKALLK